MTTLSSPSTSEDRSPAFEGTALFDRFGISAATANTGSLRETVQDHGVVFFPAGTLPTEGLSSLLGSEVVEHEPPLATAGRWHFAGGFGNSAPDFALALGGGAGTIVDFSDARLAYESLDPVLRAYVDTLSAIRYIDSTGALTDAVPDPVVRAEILQRYTAAAIPLVRPHAASGRSCLAVDETFTNYISKTERIFSHNLLGILFDHLRAPAVTGTLMLREGEAVLWDSNIIQIRHPASTRIVHFKEGASA